MRSPGEIKSPHKERNARGFRQGLPLGLFLLVVAKPSDILTQKGRECLSGTAKRVSRRGGEVSPAPTPEFFPQVVRNSRIHEVVVKSHVMDRWLPSALP